MRKDTGARSLSIFHERLTREAGEAGLLRGRDRSCCRAEQSQPRSCFAPAQRLHICHAK